VGTGGDLPLGPVTLPTRLAGTTSRFITAVAALGPGPYLVDGEPPLRSRPMAPLHDSLRSLGATVEPGETWGHLPVTVSGPLRGADAIVMPGDVSSQYVTALMLIAPLLPGGLRLGLSTELVSRPYVDITRTVMDAFGADGVDVEHRRIAVEPTGYRATDFLVEPDASSASYPLAAAAVSSGAVTVPRLGRDSVQGDAAFVDLLELMGCTTVVGPNDTVVLRRPDTPLRGIEVDMSDVSDLVPTMAVVATQAVTPTRITGVGFIRAKESDRLGDLAAELGKVGADVTVEEDGLLIRPVAELHGARLSTHHDHRLAMAFGVLGLVVDGVEVIEPDVVSKSWPGFWDELERWPSQEGTT
ncbi:MAG: 3-phosphoshikimate 1-carboxyvinyltransferase, partial [Actinomycetota bacterium]